MNREQIICELWHSHDLAAAIDRIKPVDLHDDLRQEIFIVLCEMDPERLLNLWTRKELKLYVFGVIRNMAMSDRSGFYNTHRKFGDLTDSEPKQEIPDHSQSEDLTDNLEPAISELDPYEADMIRLYAEMDSVKIAKGSGICKQSVMYAVNSAKAKLKKKLRQHAG